LKPASFDLMEVICSPTEMADYNTRFNAGRTLKK